jgi:hypothetical protein
MFFRDEKIESGNGNNRPEVMVDLTRVTDPGRSVAAIDVMIAGTQHL